MAAQPQRGYPESSPPGRFAFRHVLILLAVLCFILIACEEPDYTKPGTKGEQLPENVFGLAKNCLVTVHNPLPSPLVCNKVYKIAVKLYDPGVKCAGYNFKKIFDPAKVMVANRIKSLSLSCPQDCSPLQQRKSSMLWHCDDTGAHLELQVSLICPKPGATLPPDHEPTAAELTTNNFHFPADAEPTAGADEELFQTLTLPPACQEKKLLLVIYQENAAHLKSLVDIQTCTSRNNQPFFRTYVDRAEALAREYYHTFTCPTPCTKAPFKVFREEWGCDKDDAQNDVVMAKVMFYVDCRP